MGSSDNELLGWSSSITATGEGAEGCEGDLADSVFDLDSPAFASEAFRLRLFKVKRCPRARAHDWTCCPFAHPGEKARRRDPFNVPYGGSACPAYRRSGACRQGDNCPFAHGVFECWLSPGRYRTQMCTDATTCKRRVCFFAHCEEELRKPVVPDQDNSWVQQQLVAALATGSPHTPTWAVQASSPLNTCYLSPEMLTGFSNIPIPILEGMDLAQLMETMSMEVSTASDTAVCTA